VTLTDCKPAAGMEALRRAKRMQVAQLVKWDRSGVFGLNGSEMIACFLYWEGPTSASFSCQTAIATQPDDPNTLSNEMTALAWRAYNGAGLTPQSANKAYALYQRRVTSTDYAKKNAALAPDRMHALFYDAIGSPGDLGNGGADFDPPTVDAIELERVEVTGTKLPELPPLPSGVTGLTDSMIVPVGGLPRDPWVIEDPCVSFQVCSQPLPKLPPAPPLPPPKVCTSQCNAQASLMTATCNATSWQLASAFAFAAPTAGVIFGVGTADPALGFLIFRSVGVIGTGISGAYAATCLGLNAGYQRQCFATAATNGC
jgi:hypothetical protein